VYPNSLMIFHQKPQFFALKRQFFAILSIILAFITKLGWLWS
jgi:hypothetical protein